MEKSGLETQLDRGVIGAGFTLYATTPAPTEYFLCDSHSTSYWRCCNDKAITVLMEVDKLMTHGDTQILAHGLGEFIVLAGTRLCRHDE